MYLLCLKEPDPSTLPQGSVTGVPTTRKERSYVLNIILTILGSQQWLCGWSASLEKFCELICSRQWAEDMGCSLLLLAKPLKAAQQAERFCCRQLSLSPAAPWRAAVIVSGASNASRPAGKALETEILRRLRLWGTLVSKLLSNKQQ